MLDTETDMQKDEQSKSIEKSIEPGDALERIRRTISSKKRNPPTPNNL